MRAKNRCGGRRKPASATSTPSPMASPFVSIPDTLNAEDNAMNETSTKENVLDDVDCFQKDTCIRCDESGELLVCSEISCPIALHENCISGKPTFDNEGHFYCPYCSYKRALAHVNEMRRKAMATKRALSAFIDSRVVGDDNSQQIEVADKNKASDLSACRVDANPSNKESSLGSLQAQPEKNRKEQMASPEIQIVEDSMDDGTCEAEKSGAHQVEELQNGKMVEDENLRSMDHIQNEEAVKDQVQLETSSAHHVEAEAAVDDETCEAEKSGAHQVEELQNGKMVEEENLRSMDHIQNEEAVKDQVQLENSSAHEAEAEAEAAVDDGTCEAEKYGAHQVEELQNRKMVEEENLRSMDHIQNEEAVKDQVQLETSSAHHVEAEAAVDDETCEAEKSGAHQVEELQNGKMVEEENLRSMDHIQNEEAVKDQVQLENSSAHEAEAEAEAAVDDGTCEAEKYGAHQVEELQNRKMVEEKNLRSMDHIQNEEAVKDQVQLEISSAHHVEAEAAVDDIDHRSDEEEEENITLSKEVAGKGEGEEQIQPEKEQVNAGTNVGSGKLDTQPSLRKRRFKSKAHKEMDPKNTNSSRKSPRIRKAELEKNRKNKIEKVSTSRGLKQQKESSDKFKNLNFHNVNGKRKRLYWSTEEEEMLKEGVAKFSSVANKNLPWRKILEFGRHIFDETRTPVDLKDKWRNILARGQSSG